MNEDDIVCTCMSVSVKDIQKAIEAGARTFQEVQDITGVGTVCGVCTDDAEMVVQQLLNKVQE